jgi:hypothetical protein
MILYTSENSNNILSQSLIDDLNKKHLWNCLFYLPNGNITVTRNIFQILHKNLLVFFKVLIASTIHIQSEITGIRLQSNLVLITFLKRIQTIFSSSTKQKTNSNRLIEFSLHMRFITIVIYDTVPGR